MKTGFIKYVITFFLITKISIGAAQNYCTPSYTGTANPTSFYTHFLNFEFSNLNDTFQSPNSTAASTYLDLTKPDTAFILPGDQYPVNLKLGNGGNNQTLALWIDINQDQFFDSTERFTTHTDSANYGDHTFNTIITIPAYAKYGITRMRIATKLGNDIPDPCQNNDNFDWSSHFIDFTVMVQKPGIQKVISVKASHPTIRELMPGNTNQPVFRIEIKTNTDGAQNPLEVKSMTFNFLKTKLLSDIRLASVYYTGKSSIFSMPQLIDTTSSLKKTGSIFNTNVKLEPGKNYFWLALDISSNAELGDIIDAVCSNIRISKDYLPTNYDPAGAYTVGYCNSYGIQNIFVFIDSAGIHNIHNSSGLNSGGYGNYISTVDTLLRGSSYVLSVDVGNGLNSATVKAWIDLNRDGFLDDQLETVFQKFFNASSVNTVVKDTITIPINAELGRARLRITAKYNTSSTNTSLYPLPCESPVQTGETEDYTLIIGEKDYPVAKFRFNNTCLGQSVEFHDSSYVIGNITPQLNYLWQFGDGSNATIPSPIHQYPASGIYSVRLIVENNANGYKDTANRKIIIEAPDAGFSVHDTFAGIPVKFIDQSTDAVIASWKWNFGDTGPNNSDTLANPQHTYSQPGSYQIKFKISTKENCSDSIKKIVTIIKPLPNAYFNYSKDTVFQGQLVSFQNASDYADSIKWKINTTYFSYQGNTTDTSSSTMIRFDSTGNFTISIIAYNREGTDTFSRSIVVQQPLTPIADFFVTRNRISAGEVVSFIDISGNGPDSWYWAFGEGNTSTLQFPSHSYNKTGSFDIALIASNAAGSDTIIKKNYIIVNDEYQVCGAFTHHSSLDEGKVYDSGGDTDPYKNNSRCGFLIQPECAGQIVLTFRSFDIILNDFIRIYDGTGNTGKPLYTGNGFNNANLPDSVVATSGAMYIEEVTNFSGAGKGFEAQWYTLPNSKPSVVIQTNKTAFVNSPFLISVHDTAGFGTNYFWDFDNDNIIDTSGFTDTVVFFADTGVHKIKILSTNCAGTDTTILSIDVKNPPAPPITGFYSNDTIIDLFGRAQFFDTSSGGPSIWHWEIKPDTIVDPFSGFPVSTVTYDLNTSDTSPFPQLTFLYPGNYTVCLTASNSAGKGNTVCKKEYIKVYDQSWMCINDSSSSPRGNVYDDGGPEGLYSSGLNNSSQGSGICTFSLDPCASEIMLVIQQFNLRTIDYLRIFDGDGPTNPLYDTAKFPNGFTGTKQSVPPVPDTLLAKSGKVYFEFQTDNSNFNLRQGFKIVWLAKPVKASFSITGQCLKEDILGINKSLMPQNTSTKVTWHWGDGATSNKADSVTHKYLSAKSYDISLAINENGTCGDTLIKTVDIFNDPIAGFTINDVCQFDTFKVTNQSSIKNDTITQNIWRWENDTSYSFEPRDVFQGSGAGRIFLRTISSNGCQDSVSQPVNIFPSPRAGLSVQGNLCESDTFQISDTSTIQSGLIQKRIFTIDNGPTIEDSLHYSISFSDSGTYPYTLTVISDLSCQDMDSGIFAIHEKPVSDFVFTDHDTGKFGFQALESGLAKYEWNFGNGEKAFAADTTIVYGKDSTYDVSLMTENSYGCASTTTKSIIVTGTIGIQELDRLDASIIIYPNPAKNEFKISAGTMSPKPITVIIQNSIGQEVLRKKSTCNQSIAIPGLNAGLYFVKIKTRNTEVIKKVVVQK